MKKTIKKVIFTSLISIAGTMLLSTNASAKSYNSKLTINKSFDTVWYVLFDHYSKSDLMTPVMEIDSLKYSCKKLGATIKLNKGLGYEPVVKLKGYKKRLSDVGYDYYKTDITVSCRTSILAGSCTQGLIDGEANDIKKRIEESKRIVQPRCK